MEPFQVRTTPPYHHSTQIMLQHVVAASQRGQQTTVGGRHCILLDADPPSREHNVEQFVQDNVHVDGAMLVVLFAAPFGRGGTEEVPPAAVLWFRIQRGQRNLSVPVHMEKHRR